MSIRKAVHLIVCAVLVMAVLGLGGLLTYAGPYGVNVLLRRGGTFWVTVNPSDPRLSESMRLALKTDAAGSPGPFEWQTAGSGFEVGELPVLVDGTEVDRILLARIDPNRYRFVVRNAPAGDLDLEAWMGSLKAAAVINGSYYSRYGTPDTPLLSDGSKLGPASYQAWHGAFIASEVDAAVVDLHQNTWQEAFNGASDALVSYPMLIGDASPGRRIEPSRWLANRSFVGQDEAGKIVLGTTQNAFFSLARFAKFLQAAPLGLTRALNLDGGPLACQAVSIGRYRRDFCGKWEIQEADGRLQLLRWPFGSWALPIVLAVVPK